MAARVLSRRADIAISGPGGQVRYPSSKTHSGDDANGFLSLSRNSRAHFGSGVRGKGHKLALRAFAKLATQRRLGHSRCMTAFGPEATLPLRLLRSASGCRALGLLRLTRP